MWKGKRILVTGGAGVIGMHVVKKLNAAGATIECIDMAPKPVQIPDQVDYHKKDLSKLNLEEFLDFRPDVIFHLAAAFERTEEEFGFWSINYKDNVMSTHRIIDFSRDCKNLQKFIFASSYLVYSPSLYLSAMYQATSTKLKEADPINPRNLCGAAKYYAEKELEFVSKMNNKVGYISARIFRVYGCGSRDIISRWIRLALGGQEMLAYQKENMFDYIYAEDVAEGLIRIAESVEDSECVNLGMGISVRIGDVMSIIRKTIPDARIKETTVKGPYESSCADVSKLVKLTGWRPRVTVSEGIRKIVEYERDEPGKCDTQENCLQKEESIR